MRRLINYPWPGNIRELQNVIERAVVLAQGEALETHGFGAGVDLASVSALKNESPSEPLPAPKAHGHASMTEVERGHIESVLGQTSWMIEGERGAAKVLNLSPSTLRSRMQKLGIKRPKE